MQYQPFKCMRQTQYLWDVDLQTNLLTTHTYIYIYTHIIYIYMFFKWDFAKWIYKKPRGCDSHVVDNDIELQQHLLMMLQELQGFVRGFAQGRHDLSAGAGVRNRPNAWFHQQKWRLQPHKNMKTEILPTQMCFNGLAEGKTVGIQWGHKML